MTFCCGSHNSQIATLVERQSRYVMLAKVGSKDTQTVVNALPKHAHKVTARTKDGSPKKTQLRSLCHCM